MAIETMWEHVESNVAAAGGGSGTAVVQMPRYSRLYKLVVIQKSGDFDGFSVDMFNHTDAAADPAPADADLYRVLPLQSAVNGKVVRFEPSGYPVRSRDSSGDKIYIKISPGGAGAKTFDVAVGLSMFHG